MRLTYDCVRLLTYTSVDIVLDVYLLNVSPVAWDCYHLVMGQVSGLERHVLLYVWVTVVPREAKQVNHKLTLRLRTTTSGYTLP